MRLTVTVEPGMALFNSYEQEIQFKSIYTAEVDGEMNAIASLLGKHLLTLVRASRVAQPKGTRGFSFHWSNAQGKWDVIPANDPVWALDGAEFVVYMRTAAKSPLGKPWSLKEMQYVAQRLPPHPGFSRAVMASRVVHRFLSASPDRLDERVAKAHGFELVGLFGWDNHGSRGFYDDDDDDRDYDPPDYESRDWVFRDADMTLSYGGNEIGRVDMDSESGAMHLLKSLRGAKSPAEAVAVLTPQFRWDSRFSKFIQLHPQLTRQR